MEDDVLVEVASGLRAVHALLVVADERPLVEARPLRTEEGPPTAAVSAHVVHLYDDVRGISQQTVLSPAWQSLRRSYAHARFFGDSQFTTTSLTTTNSGRPPDRLAGLEGRGRARAGGRAYAGGLMQQHQILFFFVGFAFGRILRPEHVSRTISRSRRARSATSLNPQIHPRSILRACLFLFSALVISCGN